MRLVNFFDDQGENPLFDLKRNQRKPVLRDIFLEAMRLLAHKPLTKLELQKLVRIRKKTFIRLLAHQVEIGTVSKLGTGTKGRPFKYILKEKQQSKS